MTKVAFPRRHGLWSFLVAIGAVCAADSDLSPLGLVRVTLAVVGWLRCAWSACFPPSGDDQSSLSDTIRGMSWTIHFKDAATLEVRDGGLDFDYATGEDVEGDPPPRYAELMRFQTSPPDSGSSARGSTARPSQAASRPATSAYDAVFTDGGKVLTAYSGTFADAAKWADATALIEPVRTHFVPPDDEAAYQAHKTARETAHRNAACDAMEAALVEMKASYGAWTLWPPE